MRRHLDRQRSIAAVAIGILSLLSMLISIVPQAVAQEYSARALARVITAQEALTASIVDQPGVVGIGVGYNREGRLAIKVFLETEATTLALPQSPSDVPVIVEVTGRIVARQEPSAVSDTRMKPQPIDPSSRFPRPVPIGVSTGHPRVTAGTIGARVKDMSGNVYALSNNHIFANENDASLGTNVLQPGVFDGGRNPRDAIGRLYSFARLAFCNPFPTCPANILDAAIARSSTTLLGRATPSDGYGTPRVTVVSPSIGLRVMKYGRTTSQTRGNISAINATVNVGYDAGIARFSNQIIITPGTFSAGGDSGALIVAARGSKARKPVGLLFAGSDTITVANPIRVVLRHFGVTIDGQ